MYPLKQGNFCKGVKIYHFSSEIIFRQLLKTFGVFFWSHCASGHTEFPSDRTFDGRGRRVSSFLNQTILKSSENTLTSYFAFLLPGREIEMERKRRAERKRERKKK